MLSELSRLLADSPVWGDFAEVAAGGSAIVLRHKRSERNTSEKLVFQYRAQQGGPVLVKLIFSREDEEESNEGMYSMYCWASNLVNWLGKNIGQQDLIMSNRPSQDIFEVTDLDGKILETHVGTWMFAT
jgi:hypothetical protein